jgi:uncharacterized protein YbjT (DUF2867 family)
MHGISTTPSHVHLAQVHETWPARLAQFCADTPSVERIIHVSCLGADVASPSERLASKARGDAALQHTFPDATLIRCGPFVGIEDRYYNDFANWRYANNGVPVIDGGSNKVQPVYVIDVAEAIYRSLEFEDAKGATYELAGPEAMMCAFAQLLCLCFVHVAWRDMRREHTVSCASVPGSPTPLACMRGLLHVCAVVALRK